jgi:PPOX class probable FMN-dependent enzyme
MTQITSVDELVAIMGEPLPAARDKTRHALHELDRVWLASSPLVLIGTSDAEGNHDVSPKGDPAGFTTVIDDTTIAIPERPGNRRADSFHNILQNPRVGLIFIIPGRGDTLRVNGRARLLSDAAYFDDMIVRDHRPILALEVAIDEVFYHCSKAFLRSKAWEPETWSPESAPRRAVIAQSIERPGEDLTVLEEYYGPSYAEKIYG